MKRILGHIISGSLTEGLIIRIAPESTLEDIKTGKFVSIAGKDHTFFSLITDLTLAVTHPDILLFPPTPEETLLTTLLKEKDRETILTTKKPKNKSKEIDFILDSGATIHTCYIKELFTTLEPTDTSIK